MPIYPLWIDGDQWPDCIGLDLVFTQYIDAREQREAEGIKQLCSAITAVSCNIAPDHFIIEDALTITFKEERPYKFAKLPAGYITILLDDIPDWNEMKVLGKVIIRGAAIRVDRYKVIGQLLDEVYTRHLYKKYKPMTYGSKWLLLGTECKRVLVPWAWLKEDRREAFARWAQNRSLLACNVRPGSVWTIGMHNLSQFIGIASRDYRFLDAICNHSKAFLIASDRGLLEPAKDELSYDTNLIEEVINAERIMSMLPAAGSAIGSKTYVQIGGEVELEEFLSYWNRW